MAGGVFWVRFIPQRSTMQSSSTSSIASDYGRPIYQLYHHRVLPFLVHWCIVLTHWFSQSSFYRLYLTSDQYTYRFYYVCLPFTLPGYQLLLQRLLEMSNTRTRPSLAPNGSRRTTSTRTISCWTPWTVTIARGLRQAGCSHTIAENTLKDWVSLLMSRAMRHGKLC